MPWDMYEMVVEERRQKFYRVRAQSEKQARSIFSKGIKKYLKSKDVLVSPNLMVIIRDVRRLSDDLEDN